MMYSSMLAVNLDGAFFTAQAAAKIYKEQGSGNIIFTASVSAVMVNLPQKQAVVSKNLRCFVPQVLYHD